MTMRDAVLKGPTAAEIVALARLAEDPTASPPPYLAHGLRSKGWIITAPDGSALLTIAGRILAEQTEDVDLDQVASIPSGWATWNEGAVA
jgi:hypothetical protein